MKQPEYDFNGGSPLKTNKKRTFAPYFLPVYENEVNKEKQDQCSHPGML